MIWGINSSLFFHMLSDLSDSAWGLLKSKLLNCSLDNGFHFYLSLKGTALFSYFLTNFTMSISSVWIWQYDNIMNNNYIQIIILSYVFGLLCNYFLNMYCDDVNKRFYVLDKRCLLKIINNVYHPNNNTNNMFN